MVMWTPGFDPRNGGDSGARAEARLSLLGWFLRALAVHHHRRAFQCQHAADHDLIEGTADELKDPFGTVHDLHHDRDVLRERTTRSFRMTP